MRRTLLAACAVVALAACGTDPEVVTSAPSQQPDASTTTTTAPDLTVGPPPPEAVGLTVPDACDPWGPFHAIANSYGSGSTVVGAPLPDDGSIDVLGRRFDAPDTDGDGVPDVVDGETGLVHVRRGDGTVTITRRGGTVGTPGGQTWTGDLDGDGRDELLVYSTGRTEIHELELLLIPGTVAPGVHDPGDVGILLPWQPGSPVWSVGDHDGDGADEVAVAIDGDRYGAVVPGAQVLAPGPGGVLDQGSLRSLREVPQETVGVLELTPGVAPVFVTATDTGGDPATRVELQVLTEPPLRLRIGAVESIGSGWGANGRASGYRSGTDRVVVYRFEGGRSGYGGEGHWNLDAPCLAPTATPAPAPAPAAGPRAATGAITLPATG